MKENKTDGEYLRAEAWRTDGGEEVDLDLGLGRLGGEAISGTGSLLGGGE
jgi:hypothetical protein